MGYKSMAACVADLEKNGHLIRIKEEVDPHLEMASIHLRVHAAQGPAIFFQNVKGSKFPAVSNLFGTLERSRFIFRDTLGQVKNMVRLKGDPSIFLKNPLKYAGTPFAALKALPLKSRFGAPILKNQTQIDKLPLIQHWPMDGGAYVTLPIVYTEDADKPGVMNSNLGMYRIQLTGNDYIPNKEIGLHYQIHRGIGVHQTKANALGKPLRVSIFVGGPPSHSFAAVMPLPEGLSELTFAGALGGRRFRYANHEGHTLSSEADFVITGKVYPKENKPEGPFGDHLGYYSLKHDFPLMKVDQVYHRDGAIWPFTVVGRPPQEDTSFGDLIHEITGSIIPKEIPGLHEVNAVDEAGVHPLLFAIGSERYTPYLETKQPAELLTIANHILGFGQMSLAKFLLISAKEDAPELNLHDKEGFFKHILERVDWNRDLHFQTKTTIDTLDYSSKNLNAGSKVVIAAVGIPKRELGTQKPTFDLPEMVTGFECAFNGVLAIQLNKFTDYENEEKQIQTLCTFLSKQKESLKEFPLIVLCDDAKFISKTFSNLIWSTFTRANPSHDIYGVDSFVEHKHWGCKSSLIIDCRMKPHNAPYLVLDEEVEKRVDAMGIEGGPLHGII
ncbi:UbiD family decarboxylase [Vicingaceae bacterium]|nr:UbiD family decarboxylase [Vicingaceae bacterium]MDB4060418.1 UbiD family decarboxylase [Vicingaceae bacterium]